MCHVPRTAIDDIAEISSVEIHDAVLRFGLVVDRSLPYDSPGEDRDRSIISDVARSVHI